MKKVFISTTTFAEDDPSILRALSKAGFVATLNPHRRRLTEAEITEIFVQGDYVGLLAGLEPLTKEVLSKTRDLKVISRVGVGLDNVDLEAARKQGIKVFNTPGVLTDAVAELTIGLILAALRKIILSDRNIRKNQWTKDMGSLFKGKTLGIVGFGNIGERVAQLAQAFGVKVIFSDVRKIRKGRAEQVTFSKLMELADIISVHTSGQECLIGEKQIKAAKQGVIIVNTARGGLIDEGAILNGLSSGKIACAALDVFENEPYKGILCKHDHVILTAHIGSYAKEARILMERMAVENLLKGLKGKAR